MTQDVPDNWGWGGMFAIIRAGSFDPFEGQVNDPTGFVDVFQRGDGRPQHCQLAGSIARLPKGTPQRKFDGGSARHADRGGYFGHRRQDDGGKASRFDFALRQSNGPAANRSGWHQNHHVSLVGAQIADDGGNGFLKQLFWLENVAHDGIMPFR